MSESEDTLLYSIFDDNGSGGHEAVKLVKEEGFTLIIFGRDVAKIKSTLSLTMSTFRSKDIYGLKIFMVAIAPLAYRASRYLDQFLNNRSTFSEESMREDSWKKLNHYTHPLIDCWLFVPGTFAQRMYTMRMSPDMMEYVGDSSNVDLSIPCTSFSMCEVTANAERLRLSDNAPYRNYSLGGEDLIYIDIASYGNRGIPGSLIRLPYLSTDF